MKFKRLLWTAAIGVLYVGIMGASTCGKDAKQQIDSAETALRQAEVEEAPAYATDEYRSAEMNLLAAKDEYGDYKFNQAEKSATLAEEQADLAREKAIAEKARIMAAQQETMEIEVEPEEVIEEMPADMVLLDIHFAYDSSVIPDDQRQILADNAEWLAKFPDTKILIEGHCDERGTEEYNLALGANRAKSVLDALVGMGIKPDRLSTLSLGESMPIDPGHTEEAWAKNRRAHFAVVE